MIAGLDFLTAKSDPGILVRFGSVSAMKAIVYVHYSPQSAPEPWERECLMGARRAGIAVCVAINATTSRSGIIAAWKDIADLALVRDNCGRDLGAYRDGIKQLLDMGFRGPLAVANNSVYWRGDAFVQLFEACEAAGLDVIAATSSLEHQRHIQSFWLWFSGSIPRSTLERLIGGWRNYRTRRALVRYGEIPLLRRATRLALTSGSLFPYERVLERARGACVAADRMGQTRPPRLDLALDRLEAGQPPNQLHFFWRELLELGFPGVKRDLLTSNPSEVPGVECLPSEAEQFGLSIPVAASVKQPLGMRAKLRLLLGL